PTSKKVTYLLNIKRMIASKLKYAIADGIVKVDNKIIYTASKLRVGLFNSTENF
ncbi:MAG TPA: 3-hydroxyacyl-[acyl-carrier-protein] dehydratase FabA, partial [Oceanospirillales bacterium]|nr:3-hydroxyacyl-[acyl-carrier-protein] dehydratase FabA [Oceanospirillales bacterium]